jgi:pimeloyl-ACP methyl ester carboxylesterase
MVNLSAFETVCMKPDAAMISDLRQRLAITRWPDEPVGAAWQYGVNVGYLRELVEYWQHGFDWDRLGDTLGRIPLYAIPASATQEVEEGWHVAIEPGDDPTLPPLVMLHGWPSSLLEFTEVAASIAHPPAGQAVGRTVILVCLPGFAGAPHRSAPMHPRSMAAGLARMLRDDLKVGSFFLHGGDWGAVTATWLAIDWPENVLGVHMSMLGIKPYLGAGSAPLSDPEKAWIKATQKRLAADGGYREQQATSPTSLSFGLADSPAALAAWLIDKYRGWTAASADEPPRIDIDTLLCSVSLYWFSRRLPSANWIYWADRHQNHDLPAERRCEVPCGFSFFGNGFFPAPPGSWVERAYSMQFRRDHQDGGHFPAWVRPDLLTEDLFAFLNQVSEPANTGVRG